MITSHWRATIISILLPAAVIALGIVSSAQRAAHAQSNATAAEFRFTQLINDAAEITHLRQQQERIAWQRKPENDLLARVNATLAEAGIPSNKFASITGESDVAVTSHQQQSSAPSTLRKQTMSIALNRTTPLELGEFLSVWRNTDDLWFIERIELTHDQTTDEQHYNVRLVVAALYHHDNNNQ